MAAYQDLSGAVAGGFGQVSGGFRLRGDRVLEGHVKILLPAHQGGVRPPKGHVAQVGGKLEGNRGELLFLARVHLLGEAHDLDITEPGTGGQGGEEPAAVLLVPDPLEELGEVFGPKEVLQGDAHPIVEGGDVQGKVHVRHPGEDQAVHPAKGPGRQGVQIVFCVGNDVFHGGILPTMRK